MMGTVGRRLAPGRTAAVRAASVQFDAVTLDYKTRPARQHRGQSLHLAIGKLHHAPARVADQMVAVAFRGRGIVPVPVPDVHTLHESETIQEIDGAIDAGQTDSRRDAQGPAVHFGHLQMRRRSSHDLKNGQSSLRQSKPLGPEGSLQRSCRHDESPFEKNSQ